MLIDVGKHELAFRRTKYGHGDETDVAVLWLRLLGLQRSLLQQGHGEREARRVGRIARRRWVHPQALHYGVIIQLQPVVVEGGGSHVRRVFRGPGPAVGTAAHVAGRRSRRTVRRCGRGGRSGLAGAGGAGGGRPPATNPGALSACTCFCLATPHRAALLREPPCLELQVAIAQLLFSLHCLFENKNINISTYVN